MNVADFFKPKLLSCLATYNAKTFQKDLLAGITVGVVALPLAMAFAIASGVKPEAGIITAIVAGFLVSLLGGSKVSIGGPTGAFVVIILGIVQQYGLDNLIICTMMAGVMLFVLGALRLGGFINYFPYPLISGFTSGIAVTILSTQLKDIFGLPPGQVESGFIASLHSVASNIGSANLYSLGLTVVCCLCIVYWPKRLARYAPGPIAVLILATAVATALNLPVETIGSRFVGGIPSTLPGFSLPTLDLEKFHFLLGPAFTIALLGGIESLLCAVVADTMIDDRHNPNQELMAQGVANFVVPLFGGIPATGAIVRTATNIRNGGMTPVSGIVHAVTLLLIMLIAAPLASYVPLAVLSAILVVVAVNMGQWSEFGRIRRYPKSDACVLLLTFFLTVFFDLTVAVEVGLFAACVLFIKRMASQARVEVGALRPSVGGTGNDTVYVDNGNGNGNEAATLLEPLSEVLVFRIYGEFFFGAVQKLQAVLLHLKRNPKIIIINMKHVMSMDASSVIMIDQLVTKARNSNITVFIAGVENQPRKVIRQSGLFNKLGEECFFDNLKDAVEAARKMLDSEKPPSGDQDNK